MDETTTDFPHHIHGRRRLVLLRCVMMVFFEVEVAFSWLRTIVSLLMMISHVVGAWEKRSKKRSGGGGRCGPNSWRKMGRIGEEIEMRVEARKGLK